jgi:hypothetical protein
VVTANDVVWSTEALLGCLEAGVPVVFRGARGEALAWCFGPRRRETTLAGLLREAISRPDWEDWFTTWKASVERREIVSALHRAKLRAAPRVDPRSADADFCNALASRFGTPPAQHVRALRSAASALVAARLADAVADPELIAWAREGLHFVPAFAKLLQWELHVQHFARPVLELEDQPPSRWAAALLERVGARLDRKLGQILGDFERCLREWVL